MESDVDADAEVAVCHGVFDVGAGEYDADGFSHGHTFICFPSRVAVTCRQQACSREGRPRSQALRGSTSSRGLEAPFS